MGRDEESQGVGGVNRRGFFAILAGILAAARSPFGRTNLAPDGEWVPIGEYAWEWLPDEREGAE